MQLPMEMIAKIIVMMKKVEGGDTNDLVKHLLLNGAFLSKGTGVMTSLVSQISQIEKLVAAEEAKTAKGGE